MTPRITRIEQYSICMSYVIYRTTVKSNYDDVESPWSLRQLEISMLVDNRQSFSNVKHTQWNAVCNGELISEHVNTYMSESDLYLKRNTRTGFKEEGIDNQTNNINNNNKKQRWLLSQMNGWKIEERLLDKQRPCWMWRMYVEKTKDAAYLFSPYGRERFNTLMHLWTIIDRWRQVLVHAIGRVDCCANVISRFRVNLCQLDSFGVNRRHKMIDERSIMFDISIHVEHMWHVHSINDNMYLFAQWIS
jgi:hypothetical protein